MITADNLMKSNKDWDWVDNYAELIGDKALVDYSRRLANYFYNLPDNTEIVINNIVKPDTEDLFAKCVCRFKVEGTFNLQFSSDFTRLRKYELTKNQ